MLEKDFWDKGDSVGGLLDFFKEIGNMFGFNKFDDYVLVSLDGKIIVLMDVGLGGKDVVEYLNCEC